MRDTHKARAVIRFDRGSIECEGLSRNTVLPLECPLVWDPRVRRFRGHALDVDRTCRILRSLGFTVEDRSHDPIRGARWREIALRDYQHAALDAWRLGMRRGIVVLPTGAGKTRLAVKTIANPDESVLILVPTRVLLRQWRTALEEFYCDWVGALGDGEHDLRSVTVATFASAAKHMPSIGNRFHSLVVDEVHHFGVGGKDETLEMCSSTKRLGLTATPPNGTQLMRLARLIGPIRFEMPATELMGTHLADVTFAQLDLELQPGERRDYDRARELFRGVWQRFATMCPGGPWREFVQTCRGTDEGREALRGWHRARKIAGWTQAKSSALGNLLSRHWHDSVLVFTQGKDAAYEVARDHWIMPVTSDLSRVEREWALAAFRNGDVNALVSARVLNEGVDLPGANVAIIVGGSQGEVEFVQRVGRVLRPRDGKRAIVYELVSANTAEAGQAFRRSDDLGSDSSRTVRSS
jgi:superfamily II DNA or RNA helicase